MIDGAATGPAAWRRRGRAAARRAAEHSNANESSVPRQSSSLEPSSAQGGASSHSQTTVIFWVGAKQVWVFAPPQFSLKMHGRIAWPAPKSQEQMPTSRLSTMPPHSPTFQRWPLQNTEAKLPLSLIHISEPTRLLSISYA